MARDPRRPSWRHQLGALVRWTQAGELGGPTAAQRRTREDIGALVQNRSPAHQGAGHGGAGRISRKRLKLLTQGERERRRKLQLGTPTALGLRLQSPITIQRGNDWSFGRPVIISHLDNCTGFPTGPHVSRRMHSARGHHSDLSKAPPSSCHSP